MSGLFPVANSALITVGIAVLGLFGFVMLLFLLNFGSIYIQALTSGAKVSITGLIGMWLRKVPPRTIVEAMIMASKSGLPRADLTRDALEAHYMSGGNVVRVVRALIAASKANIELTFKMAASIDLAGRDILQAVNTSVNPKVIDCPDPRRGRQTIDAMAKDGIQLKAKARVTVRTNLDRLVGGATEETIIARVGEGIVSAIGSSQTHAKVLENPDSISKQVLSKGLDAGTAYSILSIDIADVDVGENIGARLQADQAEADKRVAQAKAEERRAMAIAQEQENIAKVAENRAKVVLAEAEVPLAMADAFRKGNLGIMDYYKMKNITADTRMRDSIAGENHGEDNREA
ncbi:MAG: flotillin-like protein FloA [Planctomycetota bacterium]